MSSLCAGEGERRPQVCPHHPVLSPQVCEPQEHRRPRRHWSISIDERRRLAMLGTPSQDRVCGGRGGCPVPGLICPVPVPPCPHSP